MSGPWVAGEKLRAADLNAQLVVKRVRVATTGAGTLASSFENGDTVDGVVLSTGDRILIKDQASGSENGIYTVNASGAPTRAVDFDSSAEALPNTIVVVQAGTANADKAFMLTTNDTITLGTTALTFAEWPASSGTSFVVACSDETTNISTGNAKVTFRMPYAMTLTEVRASLSTASSSGLVTVDINEGGSTILSTKLTVDANEKTSTTAATPAVISDAALADDAEITIDIDGAGTGAKGLKVTFIGTRS